MTLEDALVWARVAALLGVAISWLSGAYFMLRAISSIEASDKRERIWRFAMSFVGFALSIAVFAAARFMAVKLGYEPL